LGVKRNQNEEKIHHAGGECSRRQQ
jgi:hypothetical protein